VSAATLLVYSTLDDEASLPAEPTQPGTPTFTSQRQQCDLGALDVMSQQGYVRFSDGGLGALGTVSFWFRRTGTEDHKRLLVSVSGKLTLTYQFRPSPMDDSWQIDAEGSQPMTFLAELDVWTHVAIAWDFEDQASPQQAHLYLNGAWIAPEPSTCIAGETLGQVPYVDLGGSQPEGVVGQFDDVKVYDAPLHPIPP
jgi:hypothetical protein